MQIQTWSGKNIAQNGGLAGEGVLGTIGRRPLLAILYKGVMKSFTVFLSLPVLGTVFATYVSQGEMGGVVELGRSCGECIASIR